MSYVGYRWSYVIAYFELNLKQCLFVFLSFFFSFSTLSLKIRFEQSKKPLGVTFQFSHFYINQKSPPSSITYYYYVWLRCTIGDIKVEGGGVVCQSQIKIFLLILLFTGSRNTYFFLTPILYQFNFLCCHFSPAN